MKLRRSLLAALLAALVFSLSGCGEAVTYDQSAYTPSTTEGFTFTCPQAGITVTLNDEWLIYGPENYEAVIGLKQDLSNRTQIEDILNAGQSRSEEHTSELQSR